MYKIDRTGGKEKIATLSLTMIMCMLWVRQSKQFLDPLRSNNLYLGRALRLGQARGPSAAAMGYFKLRHFLGRALRLGQARGPSAAAMG